LRLEVYLSFEVWNLNFDIMDIFIRPACIEDVPRLCGLLDKLFSIESDFVPHAEKQARGLSLLINDPTGSSLVLAAVHADKVVGMATVQTLVSTAEGGRVGLVEDVIVDPLFRGQGVGTLLLERIAAWARENGLTRLQLLADKENLPALEFYLSRGWNTTRLICMRKMI
jgi:GNAT superfamily N-acetyltransferase